MYGITTNSAVKSDVQASVVGENNKILGYFREKGCDYCHTPSAELPFYSSFPVAKQLMDYDIQLGYKSFNTRRYGPP